MAIVFSPEILCAEGRKKLRELRKGARNTGIEEQALELAKKAAQLKCGIPISSLGSQAVQAFETYHALQWRAFRWGGKPVEGADVRINKYPGDHFLATIYWIYKDPNGKVKGQLTNRRFDQNF